MRSRLRARHTLLADRCRRPDAHRPVQRSARRHHERRSGCGHPKAAAPLEGHAGQHDAISARERGDDVPANLRRARAIRDEELRAGRVARTCDHDRRRIDQRDGRLRRRPGGRAEDDANPGESREPHGRSVAPPMRRTPTSSLGRARRTASCRRRRLGRRPASSRRSSLPVEPVCRRCRRSAESARPREARSARCRGRACRRRGSRRGRPRGPSRSSSGGRCRTASTAVWPAAR